jgi:hypothetical protein
MHRNNITPRRLQSGNVVVLFSVEDRFEFSAGLLLNLNRCFALHSFNVKMSFS